MFKKSNICNWKILSHTLKSSDKLYYNIKNSKWQDVMRRQKQKNHSTVQKSFFLLVWLKITITSCQQHREKNGITLLLATHYVWIKAKNFCTREIRNSWMGSISVLVRDDDDTPSFVTGNEAQRSDRIVLGDRTPILIRSLYFVVFPAAIQKPRIVAHPLG